MTKLREELLTLYLTLLKKKGFGVRSVNKLVRTYGSLAGLQPEQVGTLLGKKREKLYAQALEEKEREEKILELLRREGISFFLLEEEGYPGILKETGQAPPVLFYRGKVREGTGIVGTRKPSRLTLGGLEKLVSTLKESVISGGAQGVDLKAHQEALKRGLPTVVVLGMGILRAPSYLLRLEKEGATLLSEFLPDQDASPYTFPQRNRTIAGLSRRLYVMEAGSKSGALITARYALEYGRELFVFVGDFSSNRWEGCRKLYEEGKAELWGAEKPDPQSLEKLLSTPKTLDQLLMETGKNPRELLREITRLMVEGKVKREGAYFLVV